MGESGSARIGGGLVLGLLATVLGAGAVFWLALAGVAWSNGFARGYSWEDGESELGIGIALAFVLGWLVLLGLSVTVLVKKSVRHAAGSRVVAVLVVVLSLAVVVAALVLLIPPLPPSEFPSPPWNRA